METGMITESLQPSLSPPQQLAELIQALEQAIEMAKRLPNTSDISHQLLIFSSLHSAHHSISSFLYQQHHPPVSASTIAANLAVPLENSVSSAVGGDAEPMQVVGSGDEQNSVDRMEGKLRDFNIQNKRPKRPLSPSSAATAEQRRLDEHESASVPRKYVSRQMVCMLA
ncbi:hypothetical protein Nepgr_024337 [Nepenthes gracilis]|uniref:Uncharacterized protein n=1 Tax=Nepenthes gracilis TaxID=150966 RepID=A0AAD3T4F8_NEPGR|nr:hypothetical protein Nepgr_024337 [Nepenthes gracilis]